MSVKAGTLDDTSWLKPDGHYWTSRKQSWVVVPMASLRSVTTVDAGPRCDARRRARFLRCAQDDSKKRTTSRVVLSEWSNARLICRHDRSEHREPHPSSRLEPALLCHPDKASNASGRKDDTKQLPPPLSF